MISSESAGKVADMFSRLADSSSSGTTVDMKASEVEHNCACHAGWYWVGKVGLTDAMVPYSGWYYGAKALAKDLGFVNEYYLEDWAVKNPEIWGNKHGVLMFSSKKAFGKRKHERLTLRDISEHWSKISERLKNGNK